MRFSAHRSGLSEDEDEPYDSLWSDSEEEEFPVNPSDSEIDEYDSDSEEVEIGASIVIDNGDSQLTPEDDSEGQFESDQFDEAYNPSLHRLKRQSLLIDVPNGDVPGSSNPWSSRLATRAQINADIEHLNGVIESLVLGKEKSHRHQAEREQELAKQQAEKLKKAQQHQLQSIQQGVDALTSRRRSVIAGWREWERAEQERIRKEAEETERIHKEQERLAAEKRKREEEARLAAEREEKRKAEEKRQLEAAAAKRKDEEAKKKEEERKRLEEEERKKKRLGFTNWTQVDAEYAKHKAKIASIKETVLAPVSADAALKRMCFNYKRKIKPKLGQLTHSTNHLNTLQNELNSTLAEARQASELVYLWLLNFFCKAIVSQAEAEATVAPQAALPLGLFTARALAMHEPMTDLLMARFVKKCPQIIGYTSNIDTEEGRVRMGWKFRDGKWEDDAAYSERIAGMTSVWAVITQIKLNAADGKNPLSMTMAWTYLARQLNTPPELITNSNFSSVAAWWDVTASAFLNAYGRQGQKLLTATWDNWTQSRSPSKFPAAARLRLLGEDWIKTRRPNKGLRPMER